MCKLIYAGFSGAIFGSGSNNSIYLIGAWLRACEKKHDRKRYPSCQTLDNDDRGIPLFVIDIANRCFVRFQPSMRYMALSYVWGPGDCTGTKTDQANLQALLHAGSLLGDDAVVLIPRTVADAMALTGLLGVKYLWCDRFCIVQDDAASKLDQIAQMAGIYARAYCTIIAYDSKDSNSGLNGLPMLSGQTKRYYRLGSGGPMTSKWLTRCWTFQEDIFSTRKIKMGTNEIKWECSTSAVWGEPNPGFTAFSNRKPDLYPALIPPRPWARMGAGASPNSGFTRTGGLIHPLFPCFEFYRGLISNYTHRSLTNNEDAIHAFTGTAEALAITYPGGFIQGLPAILFPECLLWQPDDPLFERRTSESSSSLKPASWSCMGWKGKIRWDEPHEDVVPFKHVNKTNGINWSISAKIDDTPTPILDEPCISAFLYRNNTSTHVALPEGWSASKSTVSGQLRYRHDHFWYRGSARTGWKNTPTEQISFAFPFSVSTSPRPQSSSRPTMTSVNYLHGRAHVGAFQVSQCYVIENIHNGSPHIVIVTVKSLSNDFIVGLIMFPPSCEKASPGEILQIMEVCCGSRVVPDRDDNNPADYDFWPEPAYLFENRDHQQRDDLYNDFHVPIDGRCYLPGDRYDYINVLWIEKGKPAYRRGLGRIVRSAFMRDCSVQEDAVLG
ncbi:heterokaryon incompatibility protein-domain-containing protein [Hyaloscypha sp. PMI_1271]|nr:heterokaryon incompatibility protein-domain-containing protein [Hyaloscypha sp. PMI_1271]